jgi:FkbH-like protein
MSAQKMCISTPTLASLSDIMGFINSTETDEAFATVPLQVSFLRNFTVEGIEPFLRYHCLLSGIKPNIIFGNYDVVRQEILDKSSHLYTTSPEIIVVSIHLETYLPDAWRADWDANEVMEDLAGLFSDVARDTKAVVAVNTFIPPFYTDGSITSNAQLPDRSYKIKQLNQLVRDFVHTNSSRFVLIDWERLVQMLGESESMDYRFWYMSKAPFKKAFLDIYAFELVKIARALKGKTKKCLVLDCDNTLWGGVVGEVGLHNIKLDRHSYPGNAFYDFQKSILRLHERGVLVALCSKNNEQDVWEVIDNNPDCLIKRKHLSAWRVNWQDKASNLRELANELNLGLDSFVFVDDSPMECELVKELVPEVTVLKVPEKLYDYPALLAPFGLFDTLTLSTEDRQRSRMYRDEVSRKEESSRHKTLEAFLESLDLSVTIHHVKMEEVPRVAQLTQKTNQFNLTTNRYSEAQIAGFVEDPTWEVITLSVSDKFGDSGLTGVLIARKDSDKCVIDSLLMSCRILGRKIEVAFVLRSLELLERVWQATTWQSSYAPTQKNQQVADFWQLMGFKKIDCKNGQTVFELKSNTQRHKPIPYIKIVED